MGGNVSLLPVVIENPNPTSQTVNSPMIKKGDLSLGYSNPLDCLSCFICCI